MNKKFSSPADLKSALQILYENQGQCDIIAGGTDLVVERRREGAALHNLVNINKIESLKPIAIQGESLVIGATATFSDIEGNAAVKKYAQAVAEAAAQVGSKQIRNLGTIGGNIANGSSAADMLAPLSALDARIHIESFTGSRTFPIDTYYRQEGTKLQSAEMITGIEIPLQEQSVSTYVKLGKRRALAILVLGLALCLQLDESGTCTNARVSLGAVAKGPLRVQAVEEYITGQRISESVVETCTQMLCNAVKEAISNRPSMPYKSEAIRGMTKTAFMQVIPALHVGGEV